MKIDYKQITGVLVNTPTRGAWAKGVRQYALELLEFLEDEGLEISEKNMLNGAEDWKAHSWGGGGVGYIYDYQIAKRLCNKSELIKTNYGETRPNSSEEWLDVQARALFQACNLVLEVAKW